MPSQGNTEKGKGDAPLPVQLGGDPLGGIEELGYLSPLVHARVAGISPIVPGRVQTGQNFIHVNGDSLPRPKGH